MRHLALAVGFASRRHGRSADAWAARCGADLLPTTGSGVHTGARDRVLPAGRRRQLHLRRTGEGWHGAHDHGSPQRPGERDAGRHDKAVPPGFGELPTAAPRSGRRLFHRYVFLLLLLLTALADAGAEFAVLYRCRARGAADAADQGAGQAGRLRLIAGERHSCRSLTPAPAKVAMPT